MMRRLRRVNRPGEARCKGRLEGAGRRAVKNLEGNAPPRSVNVIPEGRSKAARRAVGVEQALPGEGGRQAHLLKQSIPKAKGGLGEGTDCHGSGLDPAGSSLRQKAQ